MNPPPTNPLRSLLLLAFSLCLAACSPAPEELNEPLVLDVGDFGASPALQDNRPFINKAIAAARSSDRPTVVRFEPGAVYRVSHPEEPGMQGKYAIHIKDTDNLVLDGQGATLLITHPEVGGICTEDCRNIEIKNIEIDYEPLPYAQGRIHAVNLQENWFELRVDDGFLEPDQPSFDRAMAKWGLTVRDAAGGGRRFVGALHADRWEKTGERLWRFHVRENEFDATLRSMGLQPGERYIHMARNYAQAIAAVRCENILWDNITVFSSPGLAFYPHLTSHHTIRDCHVKVHQGRIFSTNADGIHMRGSRGHALIDGCSFAGMADDAINVHSSALAVLEQPAPNQVLVKKHTFSVRPGDRLEAVRTASAEVLGHASVETVEDAGANLLLTLNRDFEGLAERGGTVEKNEHGYDTADTVFYNLSEAANPVTIRNCTFNDFRGRGVLISARGATVEGNTFKVPEGWGVVMGYESSRWAEGPIARDVVIRDNRFIANEQSKMPAILSEIHSRGGAVAVEKPIKGVRVEGNRFTGWPEPIRLPHVDQPTMAGNVIEL